MGIPAGCSSLPSVMYIGKELFLSVMQLSVSIFGEYCLRSIWSVTSSMHQNSINIKWLWENSLRMVKMDESQKNRILDASICSPTASRDSGLWFEWSDSDTWLRIDCKLRPESLLPSLPIAVHTSAVGLEKVKFVMLFLFSKFIELMALKGE
jgi:hypothetical protein